MGDKRTHDAADRWLSIDIQTDRRYRLECDEWLTEDDIRSAQFDAFVAGWDSAADDRMESIVSLVREALERPCLPPAILSAARERLGESREWSGDPENALAFFRDILDSIWPVPMKGTPDDVLWDMKRLAYCLHILCGELMKTVGRNGLCPPSGREARHGEC